MAHVDHSATSHLAVELDRAMEAALLEHGKHSRAWKIIAVMLTEVWGAEIHKKVQIIATETVMLHVKNVVVMRGPSFLAGKQR